MENSSDKTALSEVGARIRALRDRRGLNLHELALLCGISTSALSLIENGKRDLRISSLYRIAAALRVSAGDLLDGPKVSGKRPQPGESAGYDLGEYE